MGNTQIKLVTRNKTKNDWAQKARKTHVRRQELIFYKHLHTYCKMSLEIAMLWKDSLRKWIHSAACFLVYNIGSTRQSFMLEAVAHLYKSRIKPSKYRFRRILTDFLLKIDSLAISYMYTKYLSITLITLLFYLLRLRFLKPHNIYTYMNLSPQTVDWRANWIIL